MVMQCSEVETILYRILPVYLDRNIDEREKKKTRGERRGGTYMRCCMLSFLA
jgi:hypothetical protein